MERTQWEILEFSDEDLIWLKEQSFDFYTTDVKLEAITCYGITRHVVIEPIRLFVYNYDNSDECILKLKFKCRHY